MDYILKNKNINTSDNCFKNSFANDVHVHLNEI